MSGIYRWDQNWTGISRSNLIPWISWLTYDLSDFSYLWNFLVRMIKKTCTEEEQGGGGLAIGIP